MLSVDLLLRIIWKIYCFIIKSTVDRNMRCFMALFTLFIQVSLVRSLCTTEEADVGIEGGWFSLSDGPHRGSVLRYHCSRGFYAHPDPARICLDGHSWHPAPRTSTCRKVECPDPTVVESCRVFPSEPRYFYQDRITYRCHHGFTLDGPENRTCLSSGKWSGRHPVCLQDSEDHCQDPGVPPGGSRTGSIFDIGEEVTYSCDRSDMILMGSKERICQEDGTWSGSEPSCYYKYTYDTPLEVSEKFGGVIKNTLASLEMETNTTQAGRKIKITKNGTLNIFIALDISMSINQTEFEMAKKAVVTLINKIASFSVTPKYEILFFSSKIIEIVNILTYTDSLDVLVKRLEDYPIKKEDQAGTNLNQVFEKFLEKISFIKTRERTNFEKHHHTIIIFTDGEYNTGINPTGTVERIKSTVLMNNPNREEHLDIYAFGIGKMINNDVLQSLTFGKERNHFFRLETLQKLHETFDLIIDEEDVRGLCGLHRDTREDDKDMDDKTRREKYPWVLSVSVTKYSKTKKCLGSLVSRRFVLTAAHCIHVDKFENNNVQVEYKGKGKFAVQDFYKHPQYNLTAKVDQGVSEFYDYDVALIELKQDVNISFSLRPICLPCTDETNIVLKQNYTCEEQERHLIRDKEEIHFLRSKNLFGKVAHLKLGKRREACVQKALMAPGITTKNVSIVVNENFLCSGGFEDKLDHITCKGDSGGAVFKNKHLRTIQVAVVTWGNKDTKTECGRKEDFHSDEDSRDFHFNLFRALGFFKDILGKKGQSYAPLVFVD